jgi:hypothetical protein
MKKDIRSFKSAKEKQAEKDNAGENYSAEMLTQEKAAEYFEQFDENTKREAQSIEQTLKQYEGKSTSELMSELTKLAGEERKKGNLNDEKLDTFAKNVSPMLTKEQQERLSELLAQLK